MAMLQLFDNLPICSRCDLCQEIGHTRDYCIITVNAKKSHPLSIINKLDALTFVRGLCYLAGDENDIKWGNVKCMKWQRFVNLTVFMSDNEEEIREKYPDKPLLKINFNVYTCGKCHCFGINFDDNGRGFECGEETVYISIPDEIKRGKCDDITPDKIEQIDHKLCMCEKYRVWIAKDIVFV